MISTSDARSERCVFSSSGVEATPWLGLCDYALQECDKSGRLAQGCSLSVAGKREALDNYVHCVLTALMEHVLTVYNIERALDWFQLKKGCNFSMTATDTQNNIIGPVEVLKHGATLTSEKSSFLCPRRNSDPCLPSTLAKNVISDLSCYNRLPALIYAVVHALLTSTRTDYETPSQYTSVSLDRVPKNGRCRADTFTETAKPTGLLPFRCTLSLPSLNFYASCSSTTDTNEENNARISPVPPGTGDAILVSKQREEIERLQEIIARQTVQLTQLTMQVAELRTEAADAEKISNHLPTEVEALKQKLRTFMEENRLLNRQLEEQHSFLQQTFELRCALQRVHLELAQLKQRSTKAVGESMSEQNGVGLKPSDSQDFTPLSSARHGKDTTHLACVYGPLSIPSTDTMTTPKEENATNAAFTYDFDVDQTLSSEEVSQLEFEDEEKSEQLEQLLEDVSLRTSQAALQLELVQTKAELDASRSREASATQRADRAELSALRVSRNARRALHDIKAMLRRERADREQLEQECQRLLAKFLDSSQPVDSFLNEQQTAYDDQQTECSNQTEPNEDPSAIQILATQLAAAKELEHTLKVELKKKNLAVNYLLDLLLYPSMVLRQIFFCCAIQNRSSSAQSRHSIICCSHCVFLSRCGCSWCGPQNDAGNFEDRACCPLDSYPLPSARLQERYSPVFGVLSAESDKERQSQTVLTQWTLHDMLHVIKETIQETRKDLKT